MPDPVTPDAYPAQPQKSDDTGVNRANSVPDRGEVVAAAVSRWRRELAEVGGRSTLLWYTDSPLGTLDLSNAHPGGLAMLLAGRPTKLSDLFREATVLADARLRARSVREKTIELAEERGIIAGYLAVGMATWPVAGAALPPAAPILLRPCLLRPRSVDQDDFEVDLAGAVTFNPALHAYLRSVHHVDLDADALASMATVRGTFDAQPVFAAVAAACAAVPGMSIGRRLVIGTFSLAKMPMVADLAQQGESLTSHDVVVALARATGARDLPASDGIADEPAARPELGGVAVGGAVGGDPVRDLVLDADHDQQEAVHAVLSGRDLVLDGPPGTGKTQTIANMVAALVSDGRTVLLVSQKRAAIEAAQRRLRDVGLGHVVLDLHDGGTDRRRVAAEIDSALRGGSSERGSSEPGSSLSGSSLSGSSLSGPSLSGSSLSGSSQPGSGASPGRTLDECRELLAGSAQALHKPRTPWGVSAYDAQVALMLLSARRTPPESRVRIGTSVLGRLVPSRLEYLRTLLEDVAARGAWSGPADVAGGRFDDPWFGARISSAGEVSAAQERVSRLSEGGLTAARRLLGDVLHDAGLPTGRSVADWVRATELMISVRQTLEVFRPEVFDAPLSDLADAMSSSAYRQAHEIETGQWARRRLRTAARRLLRPGPTPADLHERLRLAATYLVAWHGLAGESVRPQVPADLDVAAQACAAVQADLDWLAGRLHGTAQGGDLASMSLDDLQARLSVLAARRDRLEVRPGVVSLLDELAMAGLAPLVEDLAGRAVPVDQVSAELDHVWWTSVLEEVARADPRYGAHDGELLRAVEGEYVVADRAAQEAAAAGVRRGAATRLARLVEQSPLAAELGAAASAVDQAQGYRALRDLLPLAGDLLLAAKPCWAMSPLVVASAVPPGQWFDVVIFDEASQVTVAESISAIARAGQVVVAGDTQQLAPAGFSVAAGAVSSHRTESLLDALSRVLPVLRLTTHYRSYDDRLISFSNARTYGGRLSSFPGADGDVLELVVVDVPSASAQGAEAGEAVTQGAEAGEAGTQVGEEGGPCGVEVDRVVESVLAHARSRPRESLGVVALEARDARAVQVALSRRIAQEPAQTFSGFFVDESPEPFFVKSAERTQGDERDAILLFVGSSTTPAGEPDLSFALLGAGGGERLLTVAVTRARRRMTVVTPYRAADLDPERAPSAGARLLRDFLSYVERTSAGAPRTESADAMDPLVAGLARRLRTSGLEVRSAVGATHPPLELVVRGGRRSSPEQVVVETDGPAYAAVPHMRDRVRLRQEQLARRGWGFERVWSADLFRDPEQEMTRLLETSLEEASAPGAAPPQTARSQPSREQTRDDTDLGWGERPDAQRDDEHERWLLEQRPPHWD